jgi:hypothetical protein
VVSRGKAAHEGSQDGCPMQRRHNAHHAGKAGGEPAAWARSSVAGWRSQFLFLLSGNELYNGARLVVGPVSTVSKSVGRGGEERLGQTLWAAVAAGVGFPVHRVAVVTGLLEVCMLDESILSFLTKRSLLSRD